MESKKVIDPQNLATIHDDSDDGIDFWSEEAKKAQSTSPDKQGHTTIKKSSIQFSRSSLDRNSGPRFDVNALNNELRRPSILDTLPEFELTKIERLECELKVSESRRQKVETENLDLQKKIKHLENELEKQEEYNKTLKEKQKAHSDEVFNKLIKKLNIDSDTSPVSAPNSVFSVDSKTDLYDENMISMSFNQALVKYQQGQTLHSPYFEEWDEKIDYIYEVFNRWTLNLDKIAKTGHESSHALDELHRILMEDLIAFDFSTEIVNDLYTFADMLRELASMQDSLYESVKSTLHDYIQEFNENFVKKVKESKKTYNKKFDDYFNNVSKLVSSKKNSNTEAHYQKINEAKDNLEEVRISFLDSLNEIIIHTKVDLIDKVWVGIYSFGSFFKQGSSLFERLEPQLHSSTKKVAARNNIIKHIKLQLDNEKEKCKRDGKNNDTPNLRIKDKEGFVFKQNSIKEWLLRYLIVRDESLFTVKREKKSNRYNFNDATHFWNIFLAKIRKSSDYPDQPVFEIVSVKDNKTFLLLVENQKEMQEWIHVLNLKVQRLIENPKAHDLYVNKSYSYDPRSISDKMTLFDKDTEIINYENAAEKEKDEKDNQINAEIGSIINDNICADCKTPFPEWFSINLGVLLCIQCSGFHRSLSTDVSRVRSLTLDQQTMNTLKFLKWVIQNDINHKVFEAKQSSVEKERKKNNVKDFVKAKYDKKKFCQGLPSSSKKQEDLIQTCIKAIVSEDIIKLYPIICFGMVDINQLFEYKDNEGNKENITLLHLAVKWNSSDVISLLLHNSADATSKNSNGISPEDLALIENKIDILELLQNVFPSVQQKTI